MVEPAVVEPVEEVVVAVGITGRVGACPADDGCHGFGNGEVFSEPTWFSLLGTELLLFPVLVGAVPPNKAENGLFCAF